MRIAVASESKDENSRVYPVAGRAPYYLIFENGVLVKTIKNPFAVGGGGAGFGVAQMLFNENVDLVVSGNFGVNMIGALDEKGIKHVEVSDKVVSEVVKEFSKE